MPLRLPNIARNAQVSAALSRIIETAKVNGLGTLDSLNQLITEFLKVSLKVTTLTCYRGI